jgi:hypothetical protein
MNYVEAVMSERLEHEEELPSLKLHLGESTYEATPENSSLYLFLGRFACFSHAFFEMGETEDGRQSGMYMFAHHPKYPEIADFMYHTGYPIHANLRVLTDGDRDAFDSAIAQSLDDLGDGLPDGWSDGTAA